MNVPIIIFYHGLFVLGNPPSKLPGATRIVLEQMAALRNSGLLDAASEFHVGINGAEESNAFVKLAIPSKAKVVMHGIDSRAENLTIVMIENWVKNFNGEAYVLYHHSKSATHHPDSDYAQFSGRWRNSMQKCCITNWRQCVADLDAGAELATTYWMTGLADGTQNICAGNFWWAKASFLKTVPSIFLRDRIKQSGISNVESRYEAEVWIGNGRLPHPVKTYGTQGLGGVE